MLHNIPVEVCSAVYLSVSTFIITNCLIKHPSKCPPTQSSPCCAVEQAGAQLALAPLCEVGRLPLCVGLSSGHRAWQVKGAWGKKQVLRWT